MHDFSAPLFVAWQITNICDSKCLHCLEESGPENAFSYELNREEIFRILKQIAKLNIPYVAFGGGEPLAHPNFIETCEYLSSKEIDIKIETNGHLIDREYARWFASLRIRSVQVSLDGPDQVTHERVRPDGNFDKALAACRHLVKSGVNCEIVFVPTRININKAEDVIDLAAKTNVAAFVTGPMMRIGRAALGWDQIAPTREQSDEFKQMLDEKAVLYKGKMAVVNYPWDILEELKYRIKHPQAMMLVIPNGMVKLINAMPFTCGDLRKQAILEVWDRLRVAWGYPQVAKFIQDAVKNPETLNQANHPVVLK
ncbi:radical SAM protein [Elusimicrobiota bacterium]